MSPAQPLRPDIYRTTTELKPQAESDQEVIAFLTSHWGSPNIVSRGKITDASRISRVVARDTSGRLVGLATFQPSPAMDRCELVTIDAGISRQGIGSQLLAQVENAARAVGCKKIWLITTNDNTDAAAFYTRRGYRLVAVHLDALDESRRLKPSIPTIGDRGIPLRDEWEFEKDLSIR